MNLMHLKYAVEIERLGSLNRAAESLCMGQPNLSRAIRELESNLGIKIFERSFHGMVPTADGTEFLRHAHRVLRDVDEIEDIYKLSKKIQRFSVSVPRASYLSHAFSNFSKNLSDAPAEIFYKETNSLRAVKNIMEAGYNLGIIRFSLNHEYYFKEMLDTKGLKYETVTEFSYMLVMSKNHPLAQKEDIRFEDLPPFIEIAHADPYVPSLPMAVVKKEELPSNIDRRIFVFERASQFELLSRNHDTFMWLSPLPDEILSRYNLVQKSCRDNTKIYKDLLIYKEDYSLSDLDKIFISELKKSIKDYIGK